MPNVSLAALRSILSALGFDQIQQIEKETLNVLVKSHKDVVSGPGLLFKNIRAFGPKMKELDIQPYKSEYSYVEVNDIKIFFLEKKNKTTLKHLTFGRENEENFVQIIQNRLDAESSPILVEFQERGRTFFTVKNVVGIEKVGTDTSERKKADVNLLTSSGKKVPISLKQNEFAGWETPFTYWGEQARNVLEYALLNEKTKLIPEKGEFRIKPQIAIKATPQEAKDIIFGSDIYRNGAVIKQTWESERQYKWDPTYKVLELQCTDVITELSDVPDDDEVWFEIRNKEGQKSKYLYPGLYLNAARKIQIGKDVILPSEARRRTLAA